MGDETPRLQRVIMTALMEMYRREGEEVMPDAMLRRQALLVIEGLYTQGWVLRELLTLLPRQPE